MCTSGDIAREVTRAKPGAWELPSQARYGVGFGVFPRWISVLLWFAHFSHSVHTLFLFLEQGWLFCATVNLKGNLVFILQELTLRDFLESQKREYFGLTNSAGIVQDYEEFGSWTECVLYCKVVMTLQRQWLESYVLKVVFWGLRVTKNEVVMVSFHCQVDGIQNHYGNASLDVSVRKCLHTVNGGRKTEPQCGWYRSMGQSLTLDKAACMQSCYHSLIPDLRHHVTSCFTYLLPCVLTVTDWEPEQTISCPSFSCFSTGHLVAAAKKQLLQCM